MQFRTIPPDPAEFPKARLVWPVLLAIAPLIIVFIGERLGHQWNIHGDLALIALAYFASLVVGIALSAKALASLVPALRRYPTLRTRANLACTAISATFVLLALANVIFIFLKLTRLS